MSKLCPSDVTRKSSSARERISIGHVLVLIAALAWSTSGVFIQWILDSSEVAGVTLAFWRDLGACICLVVGLGMFRPSWLQVQWRDLPWLAAMGGIGIGGFHTFWNLSIAANGVAVGSAINHTSPVFAAIGAWALWHEPLTRRKALAIALAVVGCLLVFDIDKILQAELAAKGLLLALASAIALSAYGLFGKAVAARYHPLTVATWGFGFGFLVLLPFQFWGSSHEIPQPTVWGSYAALVLLSTVLGFSAYAAGLRQLSVTVASIITNSTVIFTQIWAYLFLGERLQPIQLVGVFSVVGSVVLLFRPPQEPGRARAH